MTIDVSGGQNLSQTCTDQSLDLDLLDEEFKMFMKKQYPLITGNHGQHTYTK